MSTLLRSFLLLLVLLGAPVVAFGQDNLPAAPATQPAVTLDQLNGRLDQIKQGLTNTDKLGDADLVNLRGKTQSLQQDADQFVASLTPQADGLKAKLDVLGPVPEKGQPAEAPEVAAQRKQLNKDKADVDAQVKQAQTISLETQQILTQIAALRRQMFEAQISQRTASPLSSAFWKSLAQNVPDDMRRLGGLATEFRSAVVAAWQPGQRMPLIICLVVAVALVVVGRRWLERALLMMTSNRMPAGHLRRSALAVFIALSTMVTYGLAARLIYSGLDWNDSLSDDLGNLLHSFVLAIFVSAGIAGIGRALLSTGRPSWRIPQLSDDLARNLHMFPGLLAWMIVLLSVAEHTVTDIGAGLTTTVAVYGILTVMVVVLVTAALIMIGQARRRLIEAGTAPAKRPLWVGLAVASLIVGVFCATLGVFSGYIAFGFFVARQMLRGIVVLSTLYLLMHLFNDVFTTLFSPQSRAGKRLQESFGMVPERLEQTGIILSGIGRTFLLLFAIPIFLAPYGAGTVELFDRGSRLFAVRAIGTLSIVPGNILTALVVLVVGWISVRVIKRWLGQQLLPKTSLDRGMQMSIVTLLGYVGGIMVFVLVLGALKVDVQSIAWVASALSVGIGFGLQAVVQNFISGLILLAERPVKVGDWVSIGGVEGDIRRINVRATEVQQWDKSTVIVPNSQFITQNVRNVTLTGAQGRVQFRLPMPLDTDASKARKIIFSVMNKHPNTLDAPSPVVQLDNLEGGTMTFVCTAYVGNPRDAGTVKSDLLFEVIDQLRGAGLPLTSPTEMVVRRPAAPVESTDSSKPVP
ncbi:MULTISPECIES: DUF3772 domain-containing protein [Dyella]|uniref:Mechanosensitive ion channel family protein n=2 Tax=Dyella TaxID=231454 RepID=A0A4R0YVX4_9GAMM|nr:MULTISPECIES: DUF3772 domain-containing protein [Dyella]TBR39759.1 mechanosensitive ion channel family protein [Dyella terrae]TCI12661.1 mechanosensitive ion channel family protein [Dyella soli]